VALDIEVKTFLSMANRPLALWLYFQVETKSSLLDMRTFAPTKKVSWIFQHKVVIRSWLC